MRAGWPWEWWQERRYIWQIYKTKNYPVLVIECQRRWQWLFPDERKQQLLRKDCSILDILSFRESKRHWVVGINNKERSNCWGSNLEKSRNRWGWSIYRGHKGILRNTNIECGSRNSNVFKTWQKRWVITESGSKPGDQVSGKLWEKFQTVAFSVRRDRESRAVGSRGVSWCALAPPSSLPRCKCCPQALPQSVGWSIWF